MCGRLLCPQTYIVFSYIGSQAQKPQPCRAAASCAFSSRVVSFVVRENNFLAANLSCPQVVYRCRDSVKLEDADFVRTSSLFSSQAFVFPVPRIRGSAKCRVKHLRPANRPAPAASEEILIRRKLCVPKITLEANSERDTSSHFKP